MSSYPSISAHFFSCYYRRRHQVTLAIRQILQPTHNAEAICEMVEDVLTEWGIPLIKVLAILTYNGSNMVKAFHDQFCNGDKEEDDGLDESETIDFDGDEHEFKSKKLMMMLLLVCLVRVGA